MADITQEVNLTESLQKLKLIAEWFDEQQDVDVEEGLTKVREAASLIKSSKIRLAVIENEFREIEKEISGDEDGDMPEEPLVSEQNAVNTEESTNLDDIPF